MNNYLPTHAFARAERLDGIDLSEVAQISERAGQPAPDSRARTARAFGLPGQPRPSFAHADTDLSRGLDRIGNAFQRIAA